MEVTATKRQRLGLLGGGQMARALARGIVAKQLLAAEDLRVADPSPEALSMIRRDVPGVVPCESNQALIVASDVILLAVKPQSIPQVRSDLASITPDKLLVSIVAGLKLDTLTQMSGTAAVVRAMPNTPCLIGEGACGFCGTSVVGPNDVEFVRRLLSSVAFVTELPEELLDAVTGLSGSGPAFAYLFAQALADGGTAMGLPQELAIQLAAHTMRGAASMILTQGEPTSTLRDRVASRGGTTVAGLAVLEDRLVPAAVRAAVMAAAERSRELGNSAGGG